MQRIRIWNAFIMIGPKGFRWSSVERCQCTLVRLQHLRDLFAKEVEQVKQWPVSRICQW